MSSARCSRQLARLNEQATGPSALAFRSGGRWSVSTREASPSTTFGLGSLSKPFLSWITAALVDGGLLDLRRPLREQAPELLAMARPDSESDSLTASHLLLHQGGFEGDFYVDVGWSEDGLARFAERLGELPQLLPPGRAFSYSNAGFGMLGAILEERGAASLEDMLRTSVVEPLGLRETAYADRSSAPPEMNRSALPAAGIRSSLRDLQRLVECLPDVQPDWLLAARSDAGGLADRISYSWMLDDFGGHEVQRFGGSVGGECGLVAMIPSMDASFVGLGADLGLLGRAMGEVFREQIGLVQGHPPAVPTAELGAEVLGRYRGGLVDYELRATPFGLALQPYPRGGYPEPSSPPGAPPAMTLLEAVGENRVRGASGPGAGQYGDFLRDAWSVKAFRWEGRLAFRLA